MDFEPDRARYRCASSTGGRALNPCERYYRGGCASDSDATVEDRRYGWMNLPVRFDNEGNAQIRQDPVARLIGESRSTQFMLEPPLASSTPPVTKDASSDTRKSTAAAISSGVP